MLDPLTRRLAPRHIAVGPIALGPLALGPLALGLLLAFGLIGAGTTRARAESPAEKPDALRPVSAPKTVVELFTSQGCSSCPPADKLLGALAKRDGVLGLTLAVDYWDYLGWKDTLAKHGHSLRQKAYARMRGDGKLFTPQVILNGTAMAVGNDAEAVDAAVEAAPPLNVPVSVSVANGHLVAKVGPGSGHGEVWLCPVASGVTVNIGRGENEGATMTYHNVVRGWVRLGEWSGSEAEFSVRLDEVKGEAVDSAAILVQAGTQGAPGPLLGAALTPLH